MHTYGILKDGKDASICETAKETQKRFLDSVGEGEGGMI